MIDRKNHKLVNSSAWVVNGEGIIVLSIEGLGLRASAIAL